MVEPIKVLITGAAGRIAYSFIPHVGLGIAFGPEQVFNKFVFLYSYLIES